MKNSKPTDQATLWPLTKKISGLRNFNREKLRYRVKSGLYFKAIEQLQKSLKVTQSEIAKILSIHPSTLARRKRVGRLNIDESERCVRFAQIKDQALLLMQGDDNATITWLKTPLKLLGHETPLERANTELGAKDVEELIGRLKHGYFC